MNRYSGYEVLHINAYPRVEGQTVHVRPGIEFFSKCPHLVIDLEIQGRKKNKKIIAFTKRGAYWIRKGKKPRRIAAEPTVYTWHQEPMIEVCSGLEMFASEAA